MRRVSGAAPPLTTCTQLLWRGEEEEEEEEERRRSWAEEDIPHARARGHTHTHNAAAGSRQRHQNNTVRSHSQACRGAPDTINRL